MTTNLGPQQLSSMTLRHRLVVHVQLLVRIHASGRPEGQGDYVMKIHNLIIHRLCGLYIQCKAYFHIIWTSFAQAIQESGKSEASEASGVKEAPFAARAPWSSPAWPQLDR